MAPDDDFEKACIEENKEVKQTNGITEGHYHHDIPMTVEHQIRILESAGFSKVEHVYRVGCTSILVAYK